MRRLLAMLLAVLLVFGTPLSVVAAELDGTETPGSSVSEPAATEAVAPESDATPTSEPAATDEVPPTGEPDPTGEVLPTEEPAPTEDGAPMAADLITLSDSNVTLTADSAAYTGEVIVPEITVTVEESTLTKDTDYMVSYTNADGAVESIVEVGAYTVTVSGMGSYDGTVTKTFTVTEAADAFVSSYQTGSIPDASDTANLGYTASIGFGGNNWAKQT